MAKIKRILSGVHWAWVPAAIFSGAVVWSRQGPTVVALSVIGGLIVAAYAEWRARRRRR